MLLLIEPFVRGIQLILWLRRRNFIYIKERAVVYVISLACRLLHAHSCTEVVASPSTLKMSLPAEVPSAWTMVLQPDLPRPPANGPIEEAQEYKAVSSRCIHHLLVVDCIVSANLFACSLH